MGDIVESIDSFSLSKMELSSEGMAIVFRLSIYQSYHRLRPRLAIYLQSKSALFNLFRFDLKSSVSSSSNLQISTSEMPFFQCQP